MINIYHYSNKDFKGYIKPSFFGENSYTENSQKLSGVKRIYFYLNKDNKEYYFNGSKYLYIANISKNKLYDLNIDKLKLYNLNLTISEYLKKIKNAGYIGFYDNKGLGVVCLFKNTKINKQIPLTKY